MRARPELRYGLTVNNGVLHGLAALLVVVLIVVYLRAGKRPASYRLSQTWTHAPVLWSATDEVVPGGHGAHAGHVEVNVGGGASGGW